MTANVVDVTDENQDEMPAMGILDHLNELRIRVTRAVIGWLIMTMIALSFTQQLLGIITQPYCEHLILPDSTPTEACENKLIVVSPTENIETYFQLALAAGAMMTIPWFWLQAWKFIEPGLHKHEKKYVYIFVPAASLLFLSGAAFSWFVLLPAAISFLATFLSADIDSLWQLGPYIDFIRDFVLGIGLSFEMPLVFYFLARFGIVSSHILRKQWRFAIVGIAILSAIITPSIDPMTMMLTMAPLGVLYLFSILLSFIGYRQFERLGREDEDEASSDSD